MGREERDERRKKRAALEMQAKQDALAKLGIEKGSKTTKLFHYCQGNEGKPWEKVNVTSLTVTAHDSGQQGWPPVYIGKANATVECPKCHGTGELWEGGGSIFYPPQPQNENA